MVSYFTNYFKIVSFIFGNFRGATSLGLHGQGLWEISIYWFIDFP